MNERTRIGLLLVLAILVYANTLSNGFAFDDGFYIAHNRAVTSFSVSGLFAPTKPNNIFRPLTFASFALNWSAEGAQPLGYHLVNLLLHTAVTVLLYLLLRELLGGLDRASLIAFAAALLFAVHPIHTEAVAWITGRSELLAAGFLLAAWLLHLHDRPVAALVAFGLALLAKESAVVFLPLVFAGDYATGKLKPLGRYGWIAGVAGLYLAVLWRVQGGQFQKATYSFLDNPLASLSPRLRILNAIRIAWKYAGMHAYPVNLSCDYSYNAIRLYADWHHTLLPALAALCVLILWIWTVWKRRPAWALAGALYFLGFAVTANILVSTGTIMGERLTYLPSAGFCLLVALVWVELERRKPNLGYAVLAVALAVLSIRTVVRNRDWRDNLTLYAAAVRAVPGSARAHSLLGQEYLRRGQLDAARSELQTAVRIFPDFPEAIENYGLVEARAGNNPEVQRLLQRAVLLTSKGDADYNFRTLNLAAWLVQQGKNDDALKILNEVIADSPTEARAWSNRAVIRYRLSEPTPARADAEEALRLDPTNRQAKDVLNNLGGSSATP